jgi:hypothetical protein
LDGHIQDFVFGADWKSNMAARAAMLDFQSAPKTKILYDHPMNILAKFGSNLFCGFRKKDENVKFP